MVNYTENELRYIDKLDDYKARSIEAFDRNILTLSAGSIVLSVTFVKTFIKSFPAVYDLALVFSWLSFLATIVLVLASYLFGIQSFDNEFEEIRAKKMTAIKNENSETNRKGGKKRNYNRTIRVLRFISGITFVSGLFLLILFSCSNLREIEMPENDRVERIDNGDNSETRRQDQSYTKSLETPFNILDDGNEDTGQDSQQGNQGSEEDSSQTNNEQ